MHCKSADTSIKSADTSIEYETKDKPIHSKTFFHSSVSCSFDAIKRKFVAVFFFNLGTQPSSSQQSRQQFWIQLPLNGNWKLTTFVFSQCFLVLLQNFLKELIWLICAAYKFRRVHTHCIFRPVSLTSSYPRSNSLKILKLAMADH